MDSGENEISKHQHTYGIKLLDELALDLGLTTQQTLVVLNEVQLVKEFYGWVNADLFINLELGKQEHDV